MTELKSVKVAEICRRVFVNLEKIQDKAHKTKEEFANSLGTSRQNLDRMSRENDIKLSYLAKVAVIYKVPMMSLFQEEITPDKLEEQVEITRIQDKVEHLQELLMMKDNMLDMNRFMVDKLQVDNQELKNRLASANEELKKLGASQF